MFYRYTKKQRLSFLIVSIIVSILSLIWYMNQLSAVSMLLLVIAIISVTSQFALIKTQKYKVVE